MIAFKINPLADDRWQAYLKKARRASVFHTAGWLGSLHSEYGYRPVVYTTAPPGEALTNGVLFCRVNSWLTGRRLVSVPFADHCDPLGDDSRPIKFLLATARDDAESEGLKYCEVRPRSQTGEIESVTGLAPATRFALHAIDLRPGEAYIWERLHKTSIRQMISRAKREQLQVSRGRDAKHRHWFYTLLLATRRKHRLPPQPESWFSNLSDHLGESITFHVALKKNTPVAAIVTIVFGGTVVHKYGCSDPAHMKLGGTQLLLWEAICAGLATDAHEFDMGRSDLDNPGLIQFKERWGATQSVLQYLRWPAPVYSKDGGTTASRLARTLVAQLPDSLLSLAGRILYRHVG